MACSSAQNEPPMIARLPWILCSMFCKSRLSATKSVWKNGLNLRWILQHLRCEILEEAVPAAELVKTKKFRVEMMDAEEANSSDEYARTYIFHVPRPETGEINVVYRRKDGNYGLLRP